MCRRIEPFRLFKNESKKEMEMKSERKAARIYEEMKVNIKLKLSALWITLMLIYIYVDIFSFYKPGSIESILAGKVWVFDITQVWAVGSLVLMIIPAAMVILSLVLKAKACRWTNIIVGIIYIAVGIGTTVGESWISYVVGHIVGIAVLVLVVVIAWKWPEQKV